MFHWLLKFTVKEDVDEEQESSVTYFVDEEGRYYYQPSVDSDNITMTIEDSTETDVSMVKYGRAF